MSYIKILCMPLILIAALGFSACSRDIAYIDNSSDYVSMGLDNHDVEKMLTDCANDFAATFKPKGDEAILFVSEVENRTNDDIDTDLLTKQLMKKLRATNVGKGLKITRALDDEMLKKARGTRGDEEFSKDSQIQKGELKAPNYGLSGIIKKRVTKVREGERVDYAMSWSIVNLHTGIESWNALSSRSKIDTTKKQAQAKKEEDDTPKTPLFTSHFVMGAQGSLVGYYRYTMQDSSLPLAQQDVDKLQVNALVRGNVGVMFDFAYASVNLNALYGYGNLMFQSGSKKVLMPQNVSESLGNAVVRLQSKQVGGEAMINFLNALYVGGGVMFDIDSSYALKNDFNASFGEAYKISSYYPFAKAGLMFQPHNASGLVLYTGALFQWNAAHYGGTFFDMGLMLKI